MDFNTMPKLISDTWHLNNNRGWFFFGFSSGSANAAYLVPPQAAKGFLQELQKRIDTYEKEYGEIDMKNFKAGIQSPMQIQ